MTGTVAAPVVRVQVSTRQAAVNRWRNWRIVLVVMIFGVLFTGFSLVAAPISDTTDYGPENRNGNGTKALVQVLEKEGVKVETGLNPATAAKRATKDSTVVVFPDAYSSDVKMSSLINSGAHIVLITPYTLDLLPIGKYLVEDYTDWAAETREADCGFTNAPPKISSVSPIGYSSATSTTDSRISLCYPVGASGMYALANYTDAATNITIVGADDVLLNRSILKEDNAALALWLLGEHENLYWVNESDSTATDETPDIDPLLPTSGRPVIAMLAVTALFAMFWRGRRFGRLTTEKLPVTARPGEIELGRGRLYQRAYSTGHAAAALRAGTVTRLAGRLKFGKNAAPVTVVDAIALATGRPDREIHHLLYGPPPPSDDQLIALAAQLDDLETEVQFL